MRLPKPLIQLLLGFLLLPLTLLAAERNPAKYTALPDSSAQFSPAQALLQMQQKGLQVTGVLNVGFTETIWWVALQMPHGFTNRWVELANGHINKIDVFLLDSTNTIKDQFQLGDFYPFHQRKVQHTDFWIPPAGDSITTILLRIDKRNESLQIPIFYTDADGFQQTIQQQNISRGLFIGWLALLLITNLFLAITLKEKIHLAYIAYLLAGGLWLMAQWGIGFQWLWPNATSFPSVARPFFAGLSFLTGIELIVQFFQYGHQKKSSADKWMRLAELLLIIQLAYILVYDYRNLEPANKINYLRASSIVWLISAITALWYLYQMLREKRPFAVFFTIGQVILIIFAGINVSFEFGGNDAWQYFFRDNSSAIGLLFESTILSFGIAQRYNFYKKEKLAAEKALELEKAEAAVKVMQIQEDERQRLARELHDGLGGTLASIKMAANKKIEASPNIAGEWLNTQLGQAIEELRSIAHNMLPHTLQQSGLKAALDGLIQRWRDGGTYQIYYHNTLTKRFNDLAEISVYRIVAELMQNIHKHARAKQVSIQIWTEKDLLMLSVEDDGMGMQSASTDGIGMRNILYRTNYFGGTMHVDTGAKGTTIIISLPLQNIAAS
jgi:signal transduction histidine kinase